MGPRRFRRAWQGDCFHDGVFLPDCPGLGAAILVGRGPEPFVGTTSWKVRLQRWSCPQRRPYYAAPMRALVRHAAATLPLVLLACGDPGDVESDANRQAPDQLPTLTHDFGTVRHGDTRAHDFVLDLRSRIGPGWYSPGTHVDCSCARTELFLRAADGSERQIPSFSPETAPQQGEVLVVRAILDTSKREAVDSKTIDSRVLVVLQPQSSSDASQRVMWPLQIRFHIDSPVRLRPAATFDFERVPKSRPKRLTLTLASDVKDRPIQFSSPQSDDPRVTLELESSNGLTLLHATLSPRAGDIGSFRAVATVATDLEPAYALRIPAVATFAPDLEAIPMAKIAIRSDLRTSQSESKASSQYVLVTDHDESRPADFVVASITDAEGKDASASWAITIERIDGDSRSRRVHARWIGASAVEFRGALVLSKEKEVGPSLSIELVALHQKHP